MHSDGRLAPRPFRPIQLIKLNDRDLFGNSAGEDEDPKILDSYYLHLSKFDDFLDLENPLCIASARKGMGKSALLSRFAHSLKQKINKEGMKALVIKTTGPKLLGLGDFSNKDHIYMENYWKQIICKRINLEIGSQIGLALSNNQITLVEAAEIEGIKGKNLIGSLISRMIGKIKFSPIEIDIRQETPQNWQALLENYQKENERSNVWLLIDDIDAKYVDSDEYKNLVSSFFSAIRSLAVEISSINIRATVRTDVWNNLRHFEDLDKCSDYLLPISWNTEQLRQMLVKRIHAYVIRKHPHSKEAQYDLEKDSSKILSLVFTETMPWGRKRVSPEIVILKYSNYRPRWMGQLCKMAGKKAYDKKEPRISKREIDRIMRDFGKDRVDDLIKEHGYQFDDLITLINSFRGGQRGYTYKQLLEFLEDKYISYIGASNIPPIDSHPYNSPDQLGAFLHKIDFYGGALIPSSTEDSGEEFSKLEFMRFQDDPSLFQTVENKRGKIYWSIDPSYRTYLRIN